MSGRLSPGSGKMAESRGLTLVYGVNRSGTTHAHPMHNACTTFRARRERLTGLTGISRRRSVAASPKRTPAPRPEPHAASIRRGACGTAGPSAISRARWRGWPWSRPVEGPSWVHSSSAARAATPFNLPGDLRRASALPRFLRRRPVERHALAGPFLQRGAVGGDRLLQPRRAALALARAPGARCRGCSASWPSRAARARGSIPPARRDRRRPPPPAAPCRSRARPRVMSALPRLFCVVAQSSGTRSRVRSSSAAR